MRKGWFPERQWRTIERSIPILCVDVLLIKKVQSKISAIGLIYRHIPHQGHVWCLIGGRLLLNESFDAAIARQLKEALGPKIRCILTGAEDPLLVTEYFSLKRPNSLFDPRKHAVAVVFPAQVRGVITPGGEALDFRWFDLKQLPKANCFGFGQKKVIAKCIRRLRKMLQATSK
jgi:ADP-ribose pyrophosphatase YjhB (NUDIX family)